LNKIKAQKELQVSMFQTVILLLFNEKCQWSFSDIQTATNIGRIFQLFRFSLKIFLKSRERRVEKNSAITGVWQI